MSIGNKRKSDLNLYCQKSHIPTASYTSTGPIDGYFRSTVTVRGVDYHSTSGYATKKEAENDAAGVALIAILQKEFGGGTFEAAISLLEQKYPSKSKKKSKPSAGLTEVPSPQSKVASDSSSIAVSQPSFTPIQQSTVAMGDPQSVAVWQGTMASPQNQTLLVSHTHGHPQSMAGMTQPVARGPMSAPWNQGPLVHAPGGLPEEMQGTASEQNAMSPNFYSLYPHALSYQSQQVPYYPQSFVQYRTPEAIVQGTPPRSVYLPHPGVIYGPAQGTYSPRPSAVATTTATHVTPPPGIRPIAARFPGHGGTPSPPPGFAPQLTARSDVVPGKPLHAIPVPRNDKEGLPASTANVDREFRPIEQTSLATTSEQIDHSKSLEEFCRKRHFPPPNYKVSEEGKNKYSAEVRVGDKYYHTRWKCDDFEQAKLTAAMEALIGLALVTDTGSPRKQDPSDAPSPNTSQTQSSQHSSQSISSTTISLPLSARGQSTTTSQGLAHTTISGSGLNIQPVSTQTPRLQPPSFFKNSPSPPNSQSQDQNKTPPTSSAMAANYKQILNIHCQKNHIPVAYECSSSEDSVGYIAVVKVSGRVFESLPQGTKRAAESSAAEKAVKALGLAGPGQPVDHLHGSGPHQHGAGSHHVASSPATQNVGMVSYKNLLQEHMQKLSCSLPHYETERVDTGFTSTVRVHRSAGSESVEFTSSPQPVKKAAEQEAAKLACVDLKLIQ